MLEAGFSDLLRRYKLMISLSALIQPNRYKVKGPERIFPLLNIFDSQTMISWLDMRILTLDFGQRFLFRIYLYFSIHIILYAALLGVFILNIFGAHTQTYDNDYFWYPVVLDILIFFFYFLSIISFGVKINLETQQ